MSIYKILKKQRLVNRNGDLSRFSAGIQVGGCKKKIGFCTQTENSFCTKTRVKFYDVVFIA